MSNITYNNKTIAVDPANPTADEKWTAANANEVKTAVNSKVDAEEGKGLSTNDFDDDYKEAVDNLTAFNPSDYAKSPFFESANGLFIPVLTAQNFDNPSNNATNGLSNHPSGGVVSATSGVDATGTIYLPQAIDPSRPFRFAMLAELNDNLPITALNFKHAGGDYRSGLSVEMSTEKISLSTGGENNINSWGVLTGGISVGTKIWITLSSDGKNGATAAIFPETVPALGISIGAQDYAPKYDGVIRGDNRPFTFTNGGINVWGGDGDQLKNRLVKIELNTRSAGNRVIGVWVNQNLGGPNHPTFNPPAVIKTEIHNDLSGYVIIPKKQGNSPIDLVMINHPNGFGTWGSYSGRPENAKASLMIGKLFDAGYCLFGLDGVYGTTNDASEATASNWGAPTGLVYRKGLWDFVRKNIPGTRYLYELGLSMGFLNSLRLAIQYPDQIRGIVGIGPVSDLKDCYDNRPFASLINKGFGTWYVALKPLTANSHSLAVDTDFRQISYGYSKPDDVYFEDPYVWKDSYNAGVAYNTNDIISLPVQNGSSKKLQFADPSSNPYPFKDLGILMIHGNADDLIPISQSQNFRTIVNAIGGNVTLNTISGGGHLTENTFDADAVVDFFNSLS